MDSKINTFVFYSIIIFIIFIIQSFQLIVIGNTAPDLLLIFTVIYSLSRDSFKGELIGFSLGFLLDLMSGALFGLNAFIFTMVGGLATPFQKVAKIPNFIVFIFYLILMTIIKYICYHIFFILYQNTNLFDLYFFLKIPSEIIFNVTIGILLYIICARFDVREHYEWF